LQHLSPFAIKPLLERTPDFGFALDSKQKINQVSAPNNQTGSGIKLTSSYNLASGHEAWYTTSPDGNTTVTVKSASPMKFRAVYVGAGVLEFYWVSTGKSTSWAFAPSITNPKQADTSESIGDDGKSPIVNVELGNLLLPASGIMRTDLTGEFWAHAIHFDLPHAYDLWVFILRLPWLPRKVAPEKSELNIAHNFAQASAQISTLNISANSSQSLRADVSVHGEGFKNVSLSLKRSVNRFRQKRH